uniref:Nitrate/nitrite sensing protein domain-containing protein n=1 Tax=Chrysotila carterae TaxID=13221 RepID=A0A7S4BL32_CHRCT
MNDSSNAPSTPADVKDACINRPPISPLPAASFHRNESTIGACDSSMDGLTAPAALSIRLVHATQRERGVTCGWVASGGVHFRRLLDEARARSDAAAAASPALLPWAEELVQIRFEAEKAVAAAEATAEPSFSVSSVAAAARAGASERRADQTGGSFRFLGRDFNQRSAPVLLSSINDLCESSAGMRETAKPSDAAKPAVCPSEYVGRAALFYGLLIRYSSLNRRLIDATYPDDGSFGLSPARSGAAAERSFARLKEATGVERAFLCGALALGDDEFGRLPPQAFSMLVALLQEQQQLEAKVRETAPPSLLDLITAGFDISPELREMRASFTADFDLSKLRERMGAERCWAIMTRHLDKLERLQLLISAKVSNVSPQLGLDASSEQDSLLWRTALTKSPSALLSITQALLALRRPSRTIHPLLPLRQMCAVALLPTKSALGAAALRNVHMTLLNAVDELAMPFSPHGCTYPN